MASNYLSGVSGQEPEISGEWTPICVQCGNKFEAIGEEDYCSTCKVSILINNYYKGGK